MRIRVLGSGAADGWPNPWCSCASCVAAAEQGVIRAQTSLLLDDTVLLDVGPAATQAAVRQGVSLAGVRLVLVGHRHEDHHHAMAWVWRGWASGVEPLTVVAPPLVLAAASFDPTVTAVAASPGDVLTVEGYEVRVLEANHPDDAVLYDVTGPDGTRVLYATDTGVLDDGMVEAVRDCDFDVVLLELAGTPIPSHLTLETWPAQVERLREVGAVTGRTDLRAIHVGHHNPPPDELDRRLALLGARSCRDGEVLGGHRTLVLGGQSSGKSAYAESLMGPQTLYVATAPRRDDADWDRRIEAHAARRPATWRTVETPDVAGVLRTETGDVLVDDLGLWLTCVLDGHWDSPDAREVFAAALDELLEAWSSTAARVVLVAPEVGSGVVPMTSSGRLFADLLGRASTALAGRSDVVMQVVAGQPRRLR